ncbi:tol-pal system protein YbgF [Hymenobacter sp. PAMC 26628]|uniref:tol-pal system protein YbgF n=1 Tax=Hymenobacter sp. PAMC 26628 TaxID=1484118 RepID=UPI0007701591|nr:tol-pal system protein YbgF [Hymenobacter sp. PAMC 26628]AMJ64081.1 tol-pal system protein YbgF [Hymenobacter sp. PAMC 26628]
MDIVQFLARGRRVLLALALLLPVFSAAAQVADTTQQMGGIKEVELTEVEVAPQAVDTKGWLLLNQDVQQELNGAVHNLYNFKFDRADRQFRSLRRRYPEHPMAYFLMGLSTWWKILPTNMDTKQYDRIFFAYMDTATTKAKKMYDADKQNYEACFFLSAAYAFDARLHAERHDWRKATVSSKRSLEYLDKSKGANDLSPEFLFGQGLFNYYAVWIADEYPWLRPVLFFFPKGNRDVGITQLRTVGKTGFYTAIEARFFLMRILGSEREHEETAALNVARQLVAEFPDNSYFERNYAMLCFREGDWAGCEQASKSILRKLNEGMPGYEGYSGRYATYFLGFLMQYRYHKLDVARDYYQRCIVFSETLANTSGGYYQGAAFNLGKLAEDDADLRGTKRYYQMVVTGGDRTAPSYKEATTWLKGHK